MDEAKKIRKLARYWLTKHTTTLQQAIDTSSTTVTELSALVEEFNRKVSRLEDAQRALEVLIEDDDLDAHVDEAEKYLYEKNKVKYKAVEMIELASNQTNSDDNGSIAASSSSAASVAAGVQLALAEAKLPKLELPRFGGDVFDWTPFYDAFMAHIGNKPNINPVAKFSHLLSLLDGEAKRTVKSYRLTADNYQPALDMLVERFGRPAFIRLRHINALLQLEPPSNRDSRGHDYIPALWKMLDNIVSHTQALANLGCAGEQIEAILCPIIIQRFPKSFRDEWSRDSQGHESDLKHTLKFIRNEVERLERSEAFQSSNSIQEKTERKKSSASALHSSSDSSVGSMGACGFCKGAHKSYNCSLYKNAPLHIRRQKLKDSMLCFRCLQPHFASGCNFKCNRCHGAHHRSICSGSRNGSTASNAGRPGATQGWRPGNGMAYGPSQGTAQGAPQQSGYSFVPQQQGGFNFVPVPQQGSEPHNTGASNLPQPNQPGPALASANLSSTATVLQTAKVYVKSPGGWVLATLLFDSGSDRTYVSSSVVKGCRPQQVGKEWISYSSFGGEHSSNSKLSTVFNLEILDVVGASHNLSAAEIPVICPPLTRMCVPQAVLDAFSHVHMADDYANNTNLQIDILVGLDSYWKFIGTSTPIQHEGLVAQPSVFGYILSGSWQTASIHHENTQLLCTQQPCEADLSQFWSLESVGIMPKESVQGTIDRHPVLTQFNKELQYSTLLGRYQVALPFKTETSKDDLVNNLGIATKRLHALHRKLDQDKVLQEEYYGVLYDYLHQGIIERIPTGEIHKQEGVFYMPHRPVIKEGSSLRVRPVFDCSAKSYNGKSLNDLLETGPSLNPDLCSVMIRFRRWPVPLSGDVTKAFLQLFVRPDDKDVHRFLIKEGNDLVHMRFTRVPFGNTSSPFILNAVIRYHLSCFPESDLIKELQDDIYVDNYLGGADSEEEAIKKYQDASAILSSAGLTLSKWTTSSKSVSEHFGISEVIDDNHTEMVLGIKWMALSDLFYFEGFNPNLSFCSTKRSVLSVLSRLYDPLGLICPFILKAKILFQIIWRQGYDWDELLSAELAAEFQHWLEDSRSLVDAHFPRAYFPNISWSLIADKVELHAFGDASERGYGSVVYLRILYEGKYHIAFCAARSRVAPIKKVSLPRLELLSALMCARLVDFVQTSLKLGNVKIFCYTDSQVSLSWIKSDPLRFKTFIANRAAEIQSLVSPSCWYHCPGRYNPADIASRGLLASELKNCERWLKGPEWLGMYAQIPYAEEVSTELVDLQLTSLTTCNSANLFTFERFGTLNKVVIYVARVLRFIRNCRSNSRNARTVGPFTTEERTNARTAIWRSVQREQYGLEVAHLEDGKPIPRDSSLSKLNPFLCEQGLLRIRGRLDNADLEYNAKYPIIIPSGHIAKLLLRFQHVYLNHSGVGSVVASLRNKFWIIKARLLAKSMVKSCVPCRRQDSRACNEVAAALPSDRVCRAPAFSRIGVDYAGPMYCSDFPSLKLYILLFTCCVTRAIHLELTKSLLTFDFLLALRRFTARRGVPTKIYSDNARTFTSAARQLSNHYGVHAPVWQFIVPRAPWAGGFWERLVRSVKSALRKSLGTNSLTKRELETVFCEVEHSINSRPITQISDQPGEVGPLTPAHFLLEQPLGIQLQEDLVLPLSAAELAEKHSARQICLAKFWKIWKDQYITNLPPIVRSHKAGGTVAVGDIVLVRDEPKVPRLRWPLARVVKLHSGGDGKVRSVDVRMTKGVVCRPIQRLHRLEVCTLQDREPDEITPAIVDNRLRNLENNVPQDFEVLEDNPDSRESSHVTVTRSGRISKPPERLCFKRNYL